MPTIKSLVKVLAHQLASASGVVDQLHAAELRLATQSKHLTALGAMLEAVTHKLDAVANKPLEPANRVAQIELALKYRELWQNHVRLPFRDVEFRSYSQNGEDGILWYIFSIIGTTNKKSVEMCVEDGRQCNTANLIINDGWTGLLVDGSEDNVQRGKAYYASHPDTFVDPPKFVQAWVTAENADTLIKDNGFAGEIDLFSLDLDGVDYWIWDSIKCISPRVVIAEIQTIWGAERSVTVPYSPDFHGEFFEGKAVYCGASLPAFVKLARQKGYRLIGCQRYGFNAVFLRNDIGNDAFPEVEASACFEHPFPQRTYEFRSMVADKEWVEV